MDVPSTDDPTAIEAFRALLDGTGYEQGLNAALTAGERTRLGPFDAPVHVRRLATGGLLSVLIKLYAVGVPVERDEAERARLPLEQLASIGVLRVDGAVVRSHLRILPFDGLLVAGERAEPPEVRADHVGTVNRSSAALANLTVRRPAARALDLGTGCGVQALLAARHCTRVVATDVNARALGFARFNRALNGISNVEEREGSWLDPVEGERFDLVVANPPYVVSPDHQLIYRDAGLPGDEASRRVVAAVPGVLDEGGFATILCNWVHARDQDWWEPVRSWIEGGGCDAWVLRSATSDALTYAAVWNSELREIDLRIYSEALDRWLEYYRRSGIEAITSGPVVLRRRSRGRSNWARAAELAAPIRSPSGEHIERLFAGVDRAQAPDAEIEATAFRPAPDIVFGQEFVASNGRLAAGALTARTTMGLEPRIDPRLLPVLLRCDGRRPLSDVVAEAAPEAGMRADELRALAVTAMRALLEGGLVTPVDQ